MAPLWTLRRCRVAYRGALFLKPMHKQAERLQCFMEHGVDLAVQTDAASGDNWENEPPFVSIP